MAASTISSSGTLGDDPKQDPHRVRSCDTGVTSFRGPRSIESLWLLVAVQSLYLDWLEPVEHHVIRRLEEYSGERWTLDRLKQCVTEVPELHVEEHPWDPCRCRFHLVDYPSQSFVNLTALSDPYPLELWRDLQLLVDHRRSEWAQGIASSRYDCARVLRMHMPTLREYRFGQVCHIVQLAVRLRCIFGYRNGHIVPYALSRDCEKHSKACARQPVRQNLPSHTGVASWHDFQAILRDILQDPSYFDGVPLMYLKRLFRERAGLQLSETALGCSTLKKVFEDPTISKLCRLQRIRSDLVIQRVQEVTHGLAEPNEEPQEQLLATQHHICQTPSPKSSNWPRDSLGFSTGEAAACMARQVLPPVPVFATPSLSSCCPEGAVGGLGCTTPSDPPGCFCSSGIMPGWSCTSESSLMPALVPHGNNTWPQPQLAPQGLLLPQPQSPASAPDGLFGIL
mmetsp:Transcript_123987/g.246888  ORF Transcript_123987/g.246888 Transcript_123987/m.246888 type:complete len:453 (-) Transcript_123987:82-1440(-)